MADKRTATGIVTTPFADTLGVDVLLGMTASDAWEIVEALDAYKPGINLGQREMAARLRAVLMADPAETDGLALS